MMASEWNALRISESKATFLFRREKLLLVQLLFVSCTQKMLFPTRRNLWMRHRLGAARMLLCPVRDVTWLLMLLLESPRDFFPMFTARQLSAIKPNCRQVRAYISAPKSGSPRSHRLVKKRMIVQDISIQTECSQKKWSGKSSTISWEKTLQIWISVSEIQWKFAQYSTTKKN